MTLMKNQASSFLNLVPQLIKATIPTMQDMVKEAVTSSFPSHGDFGARNNKLGTAQVGAISNAQK